MPALRPVISEFLDALRLDRGASPKTVEAYGTDLAHFERWLSTQGIPDAPLIEQISPETLRTYIQSEQGRGMSPRTLARRSSSLRQLFRFCCQEKGLRVDPSEDLESPQGAVTLPKTLSHAEIEKLLTAVQSGLPYPLEKTDPAKAQALQGRDRTILFLLYATGLRVSELVGLSTHALDLEAGWLRVRGKGDKERVVPFPPQVGKMLEDYLEKHRPRLSPQNDSVFVHHRGERLSRQACWTLLKRLADQAGIAREISPHTLRHSFATHLLQGGMNLRSLQLLLGHADLSTTQLYTHLVPDELRTAIETFHPRGQSKRPRSTPRN